MRRGIENINIIITHCESYWERQIIEIGNIINKLEQNDRNGRRMINPIARTISTRAKEIRNDSNNYSVLMREVVNADRIAPVSTHYVYCVNFLFISYFTFNTFSN